MCRHLSLIPGEGGVRAACRRRGPLQLRGVQRPTSAVRGMLDQLGTDAKGEERGGEGVAIRISIRIRIMYTYTYTYTSPVYVYVYLYANLYLCLYLFLYLYLYLYLYTYT
jgi:hypothetical protein